MAIKLTLRNGVWQTDFTIRLVGGAKERVRTSTGETDKEKAFRKAQEIFVEKSRLAELPGDRSVTLQECLQAYHAMLKVDGKQSAASFAIYMDKLLGTGDRQYKGNVRFHLDPKLDISKITTPLIEKLYEVRRAEGVSIPVANREIACLRAAIRRAQRHGARCVDPKINLKSVPKKTRFLSPEEFQALYAFLSPENQKGMGIGPARIRDRLEARDMMIGLLACGGRYNELARLNWGRVNFDGHGRLNLYGYKTKAERIAPLGMAKEMLERRYAAYQERLAAWHADGCKGKKPSDLIFPSLRTDEARAKAPKALRTAIEECGLNADPAVVAKEGRMTIHGLRHTFASWCLQDGMTIPEIQMLLGHKDITTTMRYAHLKDDGMADKAAEAMARRAGKIPGASAPIAPAPSADVIDLAKARSKAA